MSAESSSSDHVPSGPTRRTVLTALAAAPASSLLLGAFRSPAKASTATDAAVTATDHRVGELKPVGPNQVVNPLFDWPNYDGGITVTNAGSPTGYSSYWGGGPGAGGATATYDIVDLPAGTIPGDPPRYFKIKWSVPPVNWPGETPPYFRGTFLENAGIGDAHRFSGQTVIVSFWGRVDTGTYLVAPVMWHSYDERTPGATGIRHLGYELFESSGEPGVVALRDGVPNPNAICKLTTEWQYFEKPITFPDLAETRVKVTPSLILRRVFPTPADDYQVDGPAHYTGVGFDYLADPHVSEIDIALPTVRFTWSEQDSSAAPYHRTILDMGASSYWELNQTSSSGVDRFIATRGDDANLRGGATVKAGYAFLPGAPIEGILTRANRAAWIRGENVPPTDATMYLQVPTSAEAHGELDTFTVIAWIRHIGWTDLAAPYTASRGIVSSTNPNGSGVGTGIYTPADGAVNTTLPKEGWHFYAHDADGSPLGSSQLAFQISDGTNGVDFTSSDAEVQDGFWHMVAVTYDGQPTANKLPGINVDYSAVKLYLDGVRKSAVRTVTGNVQSLHLTSAQLSKHVLGIGNVPGMGNVWDGPIAQVALFRRVLSTEEIASVYAAATSLYKDA